MKDAIKIDLNFLWHKYFCIEYWITERSLPYGRRKNLAR